MRVSAKTYKRMMAVANERLTDRIVIMTCASLARTETSEAHRPF